MSSLRGSNCIKLIGKKIFGDLVLSIVEKYLIQCPFIGGSSFTGSTVPLYIYIQVKKKAFKIKAKIEDVGLNED